MSFTDDPFVTIAIKRGYVRLADVLSCWQNAEESLRQDPGRLLCQRGLLTAQQYQTIAKMVAKQSGAVQLPSEKSKIPLADGPPKKTPQVRVAVARKKFPLVEKKSSSSPETNAPAAIESHAATQDISAEQVKEAEATCNLNPEQADSTVLTRDLTPEQAESTALTCSLTPEQAESTALTCDLAGDPITGEMTDSPFLAAAATCNLAGEAESTAATQNLTPPGQISSPEPELLDNSRSPTLRQTRMQVLEKMGDYQLLKLIGQGGMNKVYYAYHPGLDSFYAIKVLQAHSFDSPDEIQRFQREARITANLKHPNIITVHQVGVAEGRHYLVMDYIAGQSLAEAIKAHPPSPHAALQLIRTIAQALQYAHEKRVIHRDIKPANIMIDKDGRALLMDFGLAKPVEVKENVTRSGHILGTPRYMAPEQAEGRIHDLDVRTDIYSLGAVFYEMLTGRPPFTGDNLYKLLADITTQEPMSPRGINSKIAVDLESICLKAMEKNPAQRYQNVAQWIADIDRYLQGEVVLARPGNWRYRLGKWLGRNKKLALTIGAVAVAFLLLLTVSVISKIRDIREIQRAGEREHQAKLQAWEERDHALAAEERARKAERQAQIERDRAVEHFRQLTEARRDLSGVRQAHDYIEEALRLADAQSPMEKVLAVVARAQQAAPEYHGVYQVRGKLYWLYSQRPGYASQGLAYQDQALSCFRQALRFHPGDYLSWMYLSQIYFDRGQYEEANECIQEIAILNPPNEYGAYSLGVEILLQTEGKEDDPLSAPRLRQAVDHFSQALSFNALFYWAYLQRSLCHLRLRNYPAAQEDIQRAMQLDAGDATAYYCSGQIAYRQGQLDLAQAAFTRAIESRPGYAEAHYQRARVFDALGDASAALHDAQQALQLNPYFRQAYTLRANLHERAKAYPQAAQDFLSAFRLERDDGKMAYYASRMYAQDGQTHRALECLQIAVERGFGSLWLLQQDQCWNRLRLDPRFQEILGSLKEKKR